MLEPRNLLAQLFQYIGEQIKEVDPRGYHLSKITNLKIKPSDIVNLPGLDVNLDTEGDYVWLRLKRIEQSKPNRITDKDFKDLISYKDNPNGDEPSLIESAILKRVAEQSDPSATAEERNELESKIRNEAQSFLNSYLKLWRAWAEGEKPRRKSIDLYADLFALKNQMESEETIKPVEMVWGIGVASWQMSWNGVAFDYQYPLITQAVELSLDPTTLSIDIRPRAVDPRIEMDPFIACSIDGAAEIEKKAKEHLSSTSSTTVSPFDASTYKAVLKLAAGGLDPHGTYEESEDKTSYPSPEENLKVSDSWVIFVRNKSNNYLIEDLERLKTKINGGCELFSGPLSLVTPPSNEAIEYETINFRGISSRGKSLKSSEELYFPLPYNDEQVTIVQRLQRAPGVAVQGPPGTGKTHTIANIICHYLATGKRILVTSKGEPALQVLQSKIPEEIRDLTVALLTSDREGVRQFQGSIDAIQQKVSQLNPEQAREEIKILQQSIDRTHSELLLIDKRVDEIAISQLSEIQVDGELLRAQKMAELVVEGHAKYSWFDDSLTLDPSNTHPLDENDVVRLRKARRDLSGDIIYIKNKVPHVDELPTGEDITELHGVLSKIKEIDGDELSGKLIPLKAVTTEILQAARELLELVEEAKELTIHMDSIGQPWPFDFREKCRASSYISEREALEALFDEIDALVVARAEFLKRPVEIPDLGLASTKVKEAIIRGATTGKPFGLFAVGSSDAKEIISKIKISGLSPVNSDDWSHIKKYIELHDKLLSFSTRWNQFASTLDVPHVEGGVTQLRAIEQIILTAKNAHKLATHYDKLLPEKAEFVFKNNPRDQLNGTTAELEAVKSYLLSHLTKAELARATTNHATLQSKLAGCSGEISDKLKTFALSEIGNPEIEAVSISAKWAELTAELRRINNLQSSIAQIVDATSKIEAAGATKLANRLRTVPVNADGEDQVLPANWKNAWTWSRIKSHIEKIEARDELVKLAESRRGLEANLARLYKEMVAKQAWLSTKKTATAKVLQALSGYSTAIRKIGQGTGPNAHRYRRDARVAMIEAADAVPCWIMSHSKVSESMPADIGVFDLVIVDEASQSDLWALPAIVRGKKILVVGDDKQVSPDGGFISSGKIDDLKSRFLSEQPYGVEMTPEKSLYDLASRVFAAQQVMLREHFRCVPPIIAYSNKNYYQGSIQPLRIPKASERLDPPLIDIYVEGGFRDKRDTNILEAEAICDEIEKILNNPEMSNRTLGVVSLLGFDQAKLVDQMVRSRFPAGELLHRHFDCGDARTFQGSERDIMFLSMVVDSQSSRALSGVSYEQRFNVAASRARDRMYLVRSVKGSDLSEKDLRLTLLEHFDKPFVIDKEATQGLISLCESGFEREVFTMLTDKGYRVIPQVKSGAYRIDMVVEGFGDSRLAIELDGDEYHGPDKWQADMNRQRVLERAGWTFWRCFASTWTLHKDEIFKELTSRLSIMGIEPLGALNSIPSLVEKRTWSRPTPPVDNLSGIDLT